MSLKAILQDPVSLSSIKHPISLPCGHTVDETTAVHIDKCTIDRKPFRHDQLCTNLLVKEIIELKAPASNPKAHQLTFFFKNHLLRLVKKGDVVAIYTPKEWKQAEITFNWLIKHLPEEDKTTIKIDQVVQGVLKWSAPDEKFEMILTTEEKPLFRTLISQNWAQNFAGKYFDSLNSKLCQKSIMSFITI